MRRAVFLASGAAFLALPRPASASSIAAKLARVVARMPATTGVVAMTMEDERPLYAHNANVSFPTASIIKLVIMLTAFNREAASPGALSEPVVTHRADLIGGSDFMARQPDGATFSVIELIRPMIQVSDNTAANALIGHFGTAAINAAGRAAGLHHTHLQRKFLDYSAIVHHQDNRTTPIDMAHLVYQFERGAREGIPTVASSRACRDMVKIMLGQTDKEGIPSGVPGVPVANKTGAIDYTRNDVAIVDPFGDSPFVLSILTKDARAYGPIYAGMRSMARLLAHHLGGSNA